MQVITAPENLNKASGFKVFLAGSIEQDTADRWQDKIIKELEDIDVCLLNPRRAQWDASWKQEKTNPYFSEQVKWELRGQEMADVVVIYFDPNTKAPISLLELGLFKGKALVCCPEGFWRKGNVDIVCEKYKVPMVNSLDDLVSAIKWEVTRWEHYHSASD
jgi:hypothetical protein